MEEVWDVFEVCIWSKKNLPVVSGTPYIIIHDQFSELIKYDLDLQVHYAAFYGAYKQTKIVVLKN